MGATKLENTTGRDDKDNDSVIAYLYLMEIDNLEKIAKNIEQ